MTGSAKRRTKQRLDCFVASLLTMTAPNVPHQDCRLNCKQRVIASEAKQSSAPRKERMDCFLASLLAMTWGVLQRSRGAMRPRCAKLSAPENQRAQGMPSDRCARSLACKIK